MNNLNGKIKQTQSDIKSKNEKTRKRNIEKVLSIGVIIILILVIITYIIFKIKFNNMIDTKTLNEGKKIQIICLILSIIGVCLSIPYLVIIYDEYNVKISFGLYIFFCGVFVLANILVSTSIGCSRNSDIKSIYYDSEQKVVYYEEDTGYTVEKIFDNENVTIYGEINGKIVSLTDAKFPSNVQTITFKGGKWDLNKSFFSYAKALKKLVINDAKAFVEGGTFIDNYYLNEVYINNGILNAYNTGIFSSIADVNIYLNNSSLINMADNINSLEISGIFHINVSRYLTVKTRTTIVDMPGNSFNVKKLVINDNVILRDSSLKRNIGKYIKSEKVYLNQYYSLGNQIYLPSSIDAIPDYLFGDELVSDDTKIKVYFEGTQEEWDKLSIGENGNGNYYSGNVIVTVNNE